MIVLSLHIPLKKTLRYLFTPEYKHTIFYTTIHSFPLFMIYSFFIFAFIGWEKKIKVILKQVKAKFLKNSLVFSKQCISDQAWREAINFQFLRIKNSSFIPIIFLKK